MDPYISIATLYVTLSNTPCCFLWSNNYYKKVVNYIYIYLCLVKRGINGTCLCRGLLYHYECYFDCPLSLYHAQFCQEHFVFFYHDDNFDVSYKDQVDNMISIVVQDNHWWQLMRHNIANYVLDYLHLRGVIDAL